MKLSVLIAGLFSVVAVKATIYEINFASHSDAIACQTKDILYINKVSDSHKIVGRKLILLDFDLSLSNLMLFALPLSPEAVFKH
ncbi:hypothetical protein MBANPS3_009113 [Mucor bainieri]